MEPRCEINNPYLKRDTMLIKDCPNPRPPFGENSNRCEHRFWVNMDLTFSTACEGTIRALRPLGYEIINLGNNHPNELMYVIELIERHLEKNGSHLILKESNNLAP